MATPTRDTSLDTNLQRANILQQDMELLQRIQGVLLTEQQHLERGEAWALPDLTQSKQKLTEELDQRYAARTAALRAQGLTTTLTGMREWMCRQQTEQQKSEFDHHWNEFLTLTQEIRELNKINGRLIEMHLQQIESRLKNLSKAAASEQTYGADGLPGLRQSGGRARTTA